MKTLEKNTAIYYGGDMANQSDFGVITGVESDRWGTHYNITLDDGREIKRLPQCAFSDEYKGHGGTRFVTKEAYYAFREKQTADFEAWSKRTLA